ncbi:LptF/LptG family permease [Acetonema longum]|uniref:Permease YjgP/YjgQ family protein n=1 Tax=Acetonema longum DSM 6540 TaxID=1009370 RepID=F7NII3_9FIRM|nr:LptF/LptG family permease [Acetonema longum]EGO64129.1 permease YjgP/YjgQ family protein [Acetonema longum DSM 6540]
MFILLRYQIQELVFPLLLSILGICLIFLGELLFEMGRYVFVNKVPLAWILTLLLYRLPLLFVNALPISLLFAILFSIGRLEKDKELVIMRTAGVSNRKLLMPYLTIALIFSGVSFYCSDKIMPVVYPKSELLLRKIIFLSPPPEMVQNVFVREKNRVIYIGRIDLETQMLSHVMIYELQDDKIARVITAESGSLQGHSWTLRAGLIQEYDKQGRMAYETGYQQMQFHTEANTQLFRSERTTSDMDLAQLAQMIRDLHRQGIPTTSYEVDYYLKMTRPLTPFLFVLLCSPPFIRAKMQHKYYFAAGCLLFIFVFFGVSSWFVSAGRAKVLPPVWAAWLPVILFGGLGGLGVWWADRA